MTQEQIDRTKHKYFINHEMSCKKDLYQEFVCFNCGEIIGSQDFKEGHIANSRWIIEGGDGSCHG